MEGILQAYILVVDPTVRKVFDKGKRISGA
jgi:hypothetical protein